MADKYISQITPLGSSTTYLLKDKKAIESITRDGTTFTATRRDGTTFTFTQQDNNSVTGVKGNNETNYRTGDVNLTLGNLIGTTDIGSTNIPIWADGGVLKSVTANKVLINLASESEDSIYKTSPRPGITGTLPITHGGTGATTDQGARTNLKVLESASGKYLNTSNMIYMPLDTTINTSAWTYIHGHILGTSRSRSILVKFSCIWNGSGELYNTSYLDLCGALTTFQIITDENRKPYLAIQFSHSVTETQSFVYLANGTGVTNIATTFSTDVPTGTLIINDFEKETIYSDINGNAATATALASNGTTAQFWRGDNSWSNTIKQTANAALGIDTNLKIGTARKDLNFDIANGSGTGINNGYAGGITWGSGASAYAGIYYQTSSSYGSRLHFATTNSYANGAYTRMLITHDGKIGIGTLTPSTALHVIGDITVSGLTASQAVSTDANKKLVSSNLTTESPSASGSGIEYIATISQNAVGKITATKSTVRDASASQSGVVSTGAQTFAGNKTFNGIIDINNTTRINREEHPSDAFSTSVGITPLNIFGLKNGYPVYTDPDFSTGVNSVGVYNNTSGGNVVHTRQLYSAANVPHPGTSSGYVITIQTKGAASPGVGGFVQSISSRANAVFVQIFRALIPEGRKVSTASNSMGASYTDKWLTSQEGTGKWEWYARIVHCGATGTFSSGGHIYLNGEAGTASAPVTWHLAFCNLYDITKGQYDGLRVREADISNKLNNTLTITLNNSAKTFDGSANTSVSFYAPTAGGTANTQALVGNGATTAPKWVNISPSITITAGTASATPKVNVTVLEQSGTAQAITTATTGVYGATKLTDDYTSTDATLAATGKSILAAIQTLDVAAVGVAAATGNRYISQISEANGKISATLSTATIGTATKPIWIDAGTIKAGSYELKATVNEGTTKYIAYYESATQIKPTLNAHFNWSDLSGTTKGYEELVLGNKSDRFGRLALYSHSDASGGAYIVAHNPTSWLTHVLPDTAGWIVTAGNGSSTGQGGTEQPVYVDTTGVVKNTSYHLKAHVEDGSANHLAYYSAARTIDYTPNITRGATSITIAGSSSAAAQYIVSNGTNQISLHQAAGGNRGIYQEEGDVTSGWLLYWPNGSKEAHIVQSNLIIDSGNLYAGVTSSTTERQVHARAAAGDIYIYSQGSVSGTRGLYTPAHGDDTSGRYVVQVTANNNAGFADYYDHTITKLAYSQASLADTAFTYPTVWNGYELRATTKSALRNAIEKEGIHEDYLLWGGHTLGTNGWSPIDTVLNDYTRGNGFAGLPAANITIEHSTNAGSSWTTTSVSDLVKCNLVTNDQSMVRIVASGNVPNNANPQLRIIIKCSGSTYFQLKKIHILIGTNGSSDCKVTIKGSLNSAPTTFNQTICDNVAISGWSGWNSITCDKVVGASDSQIHSLQFTFTQTGVSSSYVAQGLCIYNISGYGYMKHTAPSQLAKQSHAYTIDGNDNVTFPNTGSVIISKTQDASGTADNKPALIIGGLSTSSHIEIDSNEILAKSDGTTPTTLYLQDTTGTVSVAGSGGLIVSSLTASQAVSTDANKKLVSSNLTTADPSASGSGITYIASISQSAVGKITATKSTVRSASTSQTGVLQFTTANTNTQLELLPTSWTAVPTDDTLFIRKDTSGSASFGQVKFSTLWTYIKNHITDDLYWANIKVQDSSKTDTIPTFKTIYFGSVDPTTSGRGILTFSSTYPNYGLWYFNDSTDVITLDGHGKANSKTEADLAINALGAGIISTRNRYIPHTGNDTGTVGTTTRPVYVNAGTITQGSYELKANIEDGSTNCLAYYSASRTIDYVPKITYFTYPSTDTTNGPVSGSSSGLIITETSNGGNAGLKSGNEALVSYGDSGPQIRFKSGDTGAILYHHYDTASDGGAGSFHFLNSYGIATVMAGGFTSYASTANKVGFRLRDNTDNTSYGFMRMAARGTASAVGDGELTLGNSISQGTEGNARGSIYLYSTNNHWTGILAQGNGDRTFYLPNYAGNMYAIHAGNNNAVGSPTQPVYAAANGRITAITEAIANDTTGNAATATAANITSTDNAIVRFSGTAGAFQNSKAFVNDNGSITAGTWTANTAGSAEIDVVASSGAGIIYLYSAKAITGNRGIWLKNASGAISSGLLVANQDNNINIHAPMATNLTVATSNTYNLGASGTRWKAAFIGTADSYGSATNPIYWSNGVPVATNTFLTTELVHYCDQVATTLYYVTTSITVSTSANCWIYGTITGTKGTGSSAGMDVRFQVYWNKSTFSAAYYQDSTNAISEMTFYTDSSHKVYFSFACTRYSRVRITVLINNAVGNANYATAISTTAPATFSITKEAIEVASTSAIKTTLMPNNSTAHYILGVTGTAADSNASIIKAYRTSTAQVYFRGDTGVLMGAAWNDYAEYRQAKNDIEIEPGRVVKEVGDETLELTTERLQRGCSIVSNTFGISIGESNINKLPLAVSGRVLAYPYEDREEFKNHIGWPVCSGPNGTVSIMTEEEEIKYPSRIIGIISAVPDYEIWHGGADIIVDGRVWIKVR